HTARATHRHIYHPRHTPAARAPPLPYCPHHPPAHLSPAPHPRHPRATVAILPAPPTGTSITRATPPPPARHRCHTARATHRHISTRATPPLPKPVNPVEIKFFDKKIKRGIDTLLFMMYNKRVMMYHKSRGLL
ncbi:MAG: hypothetical protein IKC05_06760, partial [Lentisphaeria bacterium]|nr:hypothetical protein [Lentisphaeria bacterium]